MSITRAVCCALAFVAPLTTAQTLDADGERFKTELVKAYTAPTAAAIGALLHPKSQACLRSEPLYERYMMKAETMNPLPASAKISVQPVTADEKLPYRGFEFPVRPSHHIRIEYERKPQTSREIASTQVASKYIVRDASGWRMVIPCSTAEGLRRLNEMGLLK